MHEQGFPSLRPDGLGVKQALMFKSLGRTLLAQDWLGRGLNDLSCFHLRLQTCDLAALLPRHALLLRQLHTLLVHDVTW